MNAGREQALGSLLRRSAVMPVVTIDAVEHAVPLAEALWRGGLRTIEITLRTPAGLPAIERIARAMPELAVGAGTVLSADDLAAAARAGAQFAVSPGATEALYRAAAPIPWLPAIATASDVMRGLEAGHRCFKFFPAVAAGGVALLQSLHGPFPQLTFCPTGGITAALAPQFLALPQVACVGGSWLAPAALLQARDWNGISALAAAAAALRPQPPATA